MDYVGLLDASGIQAFVGACHELREIAGRSRYLEEMTEDRGIYGKAAEVAGVEKIAFAGGNAAFRSKDSPEPLIAAFRLASRLLLDAGSGVQLVGAISPYEPGSLAAGYRTALLELERRKLTQRRDTSFAFSGMTRPEPAESPDWSAPDRVEHGNLRQPQAFDDMMMRVTRLQSGDGAGTHERTDLIGVVSVDGLGMGARVMAWLQRMEDERTDDDDFLMRFEAWSTAVKKHWEDAWGETMAVLDRAFGTSDRSMQHPHKREETARLRRSHDPGQFYLPCRRVYQGGDDMVFVSDARLALSITAGLASRLESALSVDEDEFRDLRVSAGVVFVDCHYPFGRARGLAEDVRIAAKRASARRMVAEAGPGESTMSWLMNRQGALDMAADRLTMKPYALTQPVGAGSRMGWPTFEAVVLGNLWQGFAEGRNKLKDICAAADAGSGEAGANAVRALLQARPLTPNQAAGWSAAIGGPDCGFDENRRTALLDAAELFDVHWPLPIADEEAAE